MLDPKKEASPNRDIRLDHPPNGPGGRRQYWAVGLFLCRDDSSCLVESSTLIVNLCLCTQMCPIRTNVKWPKPPSV